MHDDLLTMVKKQKPHLKILNYDEDNSAMYSEREKKQRKTEEGMERQQQGNGQEWALETP